MKNKNEKRGQSAMLTVALMMFATLLAKGLGLMRTVLMASHYGAGPISNAFSEASHIPLTFFDLLFASAISGCFVPVYNGFPRDENGNISEEADGFASAFCTVIAIGSLLLTFLGIILSDVIIGMLGLDSETKVIAVKLLRIMFPMIIFTGMAYTFTGVLQSRGQYLLPAMISALSNAVVIIYFIFFDGMLGEYSIYGLAVTYLVAWSMQLIVLVVPLIKCGFRFKPSLSLNTPAMKSSVKMALPVMVSSWLTPAGLLIAMYFTSFISVEGAVTVYDYTNNAFIMIAGILTYSICNYIFPQLSRLAFEDEKEFSTKVRIGMISASALTLIFSFALFLLSDQIIAVIYYRGAFSAASASRTASALRFLAPAVFAYSVVEIGNRVFFAKKMVRYPMFAAIIGVSVNIITAIALVKTPVVKVLGVGAVSASTALGIVSAAVSIVVFMVLKLPKVINREFVKNVMLLLLSSVLSALVMFGVKLILGNITSLLDVWNCGLFGNLAVCFIVFVPGASVYLFSLKLFHISFTEAVRK